MFSYTVKVYPIQNPKSKILAYASLCVENVFEVTGFKIFTGSNGLFVKPPQHKGKDKETNEDKWFDDARFVGDNAKEVREEVFSTIIDKYNQNVSSSSRATSANMHSNINGNSNTNSNTTKQSTKRPLW